MSGVSAFEAFKDKCVARQNHKRDNVVSFLKAERLKRQKLREEAEEKKRKKKRKRKTREEKEAKRDDDLKESVEKTLARREAAGKEVGKRGGGGAANGGAGGAAAGVFVERAKKKFEAKSSKKKRRRSESDEEEDGKMEPVKSEMEMVFGKAADKVKPGVYRHSRVLITAEKMESIVESAKARKAAKNKKRKSNNAVNKVDALERVEAAKSGMAADKSVMKRREDSASIELKGILKKPVDEEKEDLKRDPADKSPKTERSEIPASSSSKSLKFSSIPGWRRLDVDADSAVEGRLAFEWLLSPVEPPKFFAKLWERKPLLVKRKNADYNAGWFSTAELDSILRRHSLLFGQNIDVVTFSKSGRRETHNPAGRAHASVVWDFYQQGCSVRLLNPQTYSTRCWKMLSTLQEYFGSFVGANVYLTPPGSQGFAPHWDDIEAFVLQLEGKKRWRLYDPRKPEETLPRFSSPNLEQSDLGECILDAELEPGDLLYFPRGVIHQAVTQDDRHSLHITVSTYQKTSWADLFEKMIPQALAAAVQDDVDFRRGLPLGYLDHVGISNQDQETSERQTFLTRVSDLFDKLKSHAPVDAAVDQLAKAFVHDSLPPSFAVEEDGRSCRGAGEYWRSDEGRVAGAVELAPETPIKVARKRILRLVMENDAVWVFYAADNLRTYHARDPACFEVPADQAENVEFLVREYPAFVRVEDLPAGTLEEKLTTANALYNRGLILTREPLDANWMYSDDDLSGEDMETLDKVLVVNGEEDDEEEEDDDDDDDVDDDDNVAPDAVMIEENDDDYDNE